MEDKFKLRQDESSHWYLVPIEKIEAFDAMGNKIGKVPEYSDEWYDLIDEFNGLYSEHMIDDPCHLTIKVEAPF